jgi:uncharacterized membrane protein
MMSGTVGGESDEDDTIGQLEPEMMEYWHPNQTKVRPFYVENRGLLWDSYNITLEVSDPNWTAYLDVYSFDRVEPGEKKIFNLTMTSPVTAREGDHVNVNLSIYSGRSQKFDSLSWREFIIVVKDVAARCEEPTVKVLPGESASFEVQVTNIGDVLDQYEVTMTVLSGGSDWLIQIDPTSMEVDVKRNKTILIATRPIVDPFEITDLVIMIRVQSTSNAMVSARVKLTVQIKDYLEANLDPAVTETRMVPGESVDIEVTLAQATNWNRTIRWHGRLDNASIEWGVSLEEVEWNLTGPTEARIELKVIAPERGSPGRLMDLLLIVECRGAPNKTLMSRLSFVIVEHKSISIDSAQAPDPVTPPSTVSFNITVTNAGNVPQTVAISGEVPEGDSLRIHLTQRTVMKILPPFSEEDLQINFGVQWFCPPGEHYITLVVTVDGEEVTTFSTEFDVLERRNIEIGSPHGSVIQLNPNGEPVNVDYLVANKGNVHVEVRVDSIVEPMDAGLSTSFEELADGTWQRVYPGEIEKVTLAIDPSDLRTSETGNGSIIVSFHLRDTFRFWSDVIEFTVVEPDLRILGLETSGRAKVDVPSRVYVTVVNEGTGTSVETSLVVYSAEDGWVNDEVTVPSLAPGENSTFALNHTVREGSENFMLKIDPSNLVIETSESNNEMHFIRHAADGGAMCCVLPDIINFLIVIGLLVGFVLFARMIQRMTRSD